MSRKTAKIETLATSKQRNDEKIAKKANLPTMNDYAVLLAKEKIEIEKDLLYLGVKILNYPDMTAPFHKDVADLVQDHTKLKKLFMLPRKHLKTTEITITGSIQKILKNPNIRILIVNAVWEKARSMLTEIKTHLEKNQVLNEIYGSFVGDRWTADYITIKQRKKIVKEATITTAGLEKAETSAHYDLIILDDLVTPENITSREQIDKVIEAYKYYLDLIEEDGEIWVLGTRYDFMDLYGWLLKYHQDSFKEAIMVRKALEHGKPIFPQKFTTEGLLQKRKDQGEAHFSCQYFNEPIAEEDQLFKPEDLRFYTDAEMHELLPHLDLYLTIDPATSTKKKSCFTAYLLMGKDYRNLWYIIEAMQVRQKPNETIDTIFDFVTGYPNLKLIGIEEVAYQEALRHFLTDEMRRRDQYFNVVPLKPKMRSKEERIKGLQPRIRTHSVFMSAQHTELEYQFLHYPKCEFIDLLDALAYQLDLAPAIPADKPNEDDRIGPENSLSRLQYLKHHSQLGVESVR